MSALFGLTLSSVGLTNDVSMVSALSVSLSLLTVTLSLVLWLSPRRVPKNFPPGPWGFPIVGYIPFLGKIAPFKIMAQLTKDYGEVCSLRLGCKTVIILNGYRAIREAFFVNGENFSGRPKLEISELLTNGRGIAFATDSKEWKEQRSFAVNALRSLGMGTSGMEEKIGKELSHIAAALKETRGAPFDPRHVIKNGVANIICSLLFGKRFDYDDPDFKYLLDTHFKNIKLCGAASAVNFIPALKYLPLSVYQQVFKNHMFLRKKIVGMIDEHRESFDPDHLGDFVDMYLNEIRLNKEREEGSSFDDDNIRKVVNDLFTTGTETTFTTLYWSLLYMITYPEVQKQVQDELDREIGEKMPTLEDKDKLPYTQATLMEIQRMASVLPLSSPHCTTVDTQLFGYQIPENTIVIANLWSALHDQTCWEQPEMFRPGRFLDNDNNLKKPDAFIPFSTGSRMCLGDSTARMEMFLFFSYLMHRFEFHPAENCPMPSLEGENGITLSPAPYQLYAVRRK